MATLGQVVDEEEERSPRAEGKATSPRDQFPEPRLDLGSLLPKFREKKHEIYVFLRVLRIRLRIQGSRS